MFMFRIRRTILGSIKKSSKMLSDHTLLKGPGVVQPLSEHLVDEELIWISSHF